MPRYHHLPRIIVIGSLTDLALCCLGSHFGRSGEIQPQQRRHRPHTHGDRLLHRLAANAQQPRRIGQPQRPDRAQRRILTQGMSCHKGHMIKTQPFGL